MLDFVSLLALFTVLVLAAERIGRATTVFKFPLITGFMLAGLLCGPYGLGVLSPEQVLSLRFVDELALAFIAFAAGAELQYRELRSQLKQIRWIALGIVGASFALVIPLMQTVGDFAPFLDGMGSRERLAVGLVAGALLVSRSPSSLMALIAELRARGPLTRLLMGVTVALDVVVIMLFAISTSIAHALLSSSGFDISVVFIVLGELLLAGISGALVAAFVHVGLKVAPSVRVQAPMVLLTGVGVYWLAHKLQHYTGEHGPLEIFIEPLLICMVAGFLLGNFSNYRSDFHRVTKLVGAPVYLAFFTLAGASLDLTTLKLAWKMALVLFFVRLLAIFLGSYFGGLISRAPARVRHMTWLGMITQAGVGLGLAKQVAIDFPDWGPAFATTIIAVIVANQVVGPVPEKWLLRFIGEARVDPSGGRRGAPRVLIFGLDGQSWALAEQLKNHGWDPALISRRVLPDEPRDVTLDLYHVPELSAASLREIGAEKARTLVGLMQEKENLSLCRIAHDELGVSNIVVRVASQDISTACQSYGATAIDPNVALVNVLDHFVRSPALTGMVVGMNNDKDAMDIEVTNPDLEGTALREIRLPLDALILSVQRKGASLISHGYTRLQKGDKVTVMGSPEALSQVAARLSS